MSKRQRALVIGGSLGGLFAANMLRAIGWHVEVFERVADDLATRGAGIGTHDELFAILRCLGIAVDASIGVEVRERVCLDRAGNSVLAVPLAQMMTAWYCWGTPHTSRGRTSAWASRKRRSTRNVSRRPSRPCPAI